MLEDVIEDLTQCVPASRTRLEAFPRIPSVGADPAYADAIAAARST